ncbi:hypothetical protein AAG906_017443 [Vitis piasezkii]
MPMSLQSPSPAEKKITAGASTCAPEISSCSTFMSITQYKKRSASPPRAPKPSDRMGPFQAQGLILLLQLWKMKMESILIQQGVEKALLLDKDLPESVTEKVWKKLEELYRTRALPNHIYLKEHLYGFKIEESKPIDDALDEFNKLVLDLESLDFKVEDEDKAIILLNSLPKSLKHFKETLKCGRDAITFDDSSNKTNSGESLTARGIPQNKNNNGN